MNAKSAPKNPVTRAQYPKFFTLLKKASDNLGFTTPEEIENYRRKVMLEEAGCTSIKQLDRKSDFDACIRRFSADAGEYLEAIEISLQDARRRAYVVKVMSIQIMQLKGGSENDARNYLEGLINQARIPCGINLNDNSFWMDVSPSSIHHLLQILDTYRRRLLKANFPGFPVSFDDTVRYHVDGSVRTRFTGIDKYYYHNAPFTVNVV